MDLGTFSVSLPVKDLEVSRDFYQKLGFTVIGGAMEHNYLIMRNGTTTIGLFQGMFNKVMLTFNPGWDADCNTLPAFTDVRALEKAIKAAGIQPETEVNKDSATGPGFVTLVDPDGHPILIDQHV